MPDMSALLVRAIVACINAARANDAKEQHREYRLVITHNDTSFATETIPLRGGREAVRLAAYWFGRTSWGNGKGQVETRTVSEWQPLSDHPGANATGQATARANRIDAGAERVEDLLCQLNVAPEDDHERMDIARTLARAVLDAQAHA